jgi:hypothetical protein
MNIAVKNIAFVVLSLNLLLNSAVAGVILPEPDCGISGGNNCLVFDDFTVFSMSLLQFNEDASLQPVSGDKYYIDSSPGKIKDDIVIASFPTASTNNSDISPTGIDDGFDTPNGGSDLFAMLATNEPSPVLANDNQVTSLLPNPDGLDIDDNGTIDGDGNPGGGLSLWDIEISELTTFLNDEDLLFFFNLNETGANDALDSGQDMLGWMRVFLTDSQTGDSIDFTLSGANTLQPTIQSQAQGTDDSILPTADEEWAYIHGQICTSSVDGSVLALSSCSAAGNPPNGQTVNQNLGANAAAFGLWNDDLNNALYSGTYDTLTVDLRMSHIENGYEQLFIRAGQVGDPSISVPVPTSIWLLLTGLASLGISRRKEL